MSKSCCDRLPLTRRHLGKDGRVGDEVIVQVDENEGQVPQHSVHEALEGLRYCISWPAGTAERALVALSEDTTHLCFGISVVE